MKKDPSFQSAVVYIDTKLSGDKQDASSHESAAASLRLQNGTTDGGFGWVVVAGSWLAHFVVLGIMYSFGIFIVPYTSYFHAGRGTVAIVGTISTGFFPFSGLFAGRFAEKYGYRRCMLLGTFILCFGLVSASFSTALWHLYITQGLLVGVGQSAAYFPAMTAVGQWFNKRRGLAMGIAVSGSGAGNLVMAPLTNILISSLGWRNTLRVIASGSFVLMLVATAATRRRFPATHTSTPLRLFKDRRFLLLTGSISLGMFGYLLPFVHMPAYAADVGLPASSGALLVSLLGIGSLVGRVLMGSASDWLGPVQSLALSLLILSLDLLFWPLAKTLISLIAFCLVFGIFGGALMSVVPVVAAVFFGTQGLAGILGLVYSTTAVSQALGPSLAGFLYDSAGSYVLPIELYAALCLMAFLVMMTLALYTDPDLKRKLLLLLLWRNSTVAPLPLPDITTTTSATEPVWNGNTRPSDLGSESSHKLGPRSSKHVDAPAAWASSSSDSDPDPDSDPGSGCGFLPAAVPGPPDAPALEASPPALPLPPLPATAEPGTAA